MSIPLTINGAVFEYPVNFDENWGVDATGWAQAVTNGMLQMAGGNFPLTADVNFGASFGLISTYYKSRTANIATAGQIRLAHSDLIEWRNFANSGNLPLAVDGSNNLTYNGNTVLVSGGSGFVSSIIGTANQIIASSPTGTVTLSTPQDIAPASTPTFFAASLTATATQLVLGTGNQIGISAPTPAASRLYTIPDTGTSTASFVMTEGTQTINGIKTFGTPITVSSGGTGNSSFTAYTLLAGGTTSTNPIQSLASVGSSGQVLTSNGAGMLPTFQNTTGSGTVNSGTATHLAYYATSSTSVSDANGATISGSYTFSGVNTFSAQDVHTAGISITGNTSNLFINAAQNSASVLQTTFANSNTTTAGEMVVKSLVDSSGGDAYFVAGLSGSNQWAWGLDNSDSDRWKLTHSSSPTPSTASPSIVADFGTGAVSIQGTTTSDSATSGYVGEYIEAVTGQTNATTSNAYADLASISLTAGDWDVNALGYWDNNGATWSDAVIGISTTSGNSGAGLVDGSNKMNAAFANSSTTQIRYPMTIASYRVSLSGTTTIYFKYLAVYSAGTPNFRGRISARRMR